MEGTVSIGSETAENASNLLTPQARIEPPKKLQLALIPLSIPAPKNAGVTARVC